MPIKNIYLSLFTLENQKYLHIFVYSLKIKIFNRLCVARSKIFTPHFLSLDNDKYLIVIDNPVIVKNIYSFLAYDNKKYLPDFV